MPTMTERRKELAPLMAAAPPMLIEPVSRYLPDPGEPPLTEDELAGLAEARRELADGRGVPFFDALKDLW